MKGCKNIRETMLDKRHAYGNTCRQWREMRGISQEAMARFLELRDAKAVSRLENGESPWSLELLEGWALVVEAGSVPNLLTQPDRVHFDHGNKAAPHGTNISHYEGSTMEREQLLERIKHLEEEVLHLRKSEEFLWEYLRTALGG